MKIDSTELAKAVKYGNLHLEFIDGIFVSEIIVKDGVKYLFSDKLNETWVNCACALEIKTLNIGNFVSNVTNFYSAKNRKPSVFLLENESSDNLLSSLKVDGFNHDYSDSLMIFGDNSTRQLVDGFTVRKVKNSDEMELFIDLFYKAHTGSEGEVYGEAAKEYRECFTNAYLNPETNVIREYYIGYMNNEPTSYGCIFIKDNVAGLYAIGTIPEYRRKGLARDVSLYMVNKAKELGADDIFLLTENNSINEQIYAKMGFKTKFVYSGYSK